MLAIPLHRNCDSDLLFAASFQRNPAQHPTPPPTFDGSSRHQPSISHQVGRPVCIFTNRHNVGNLQFHSSRIWDLVTSSVSMASVHARQRYSANGQIAEAATTITQTCTHPPPPHPSIFLSHVLSGNTQVVGRLVCI